MGREEAKHAGSLIEATDENHPFPLTSVDRHNLSIPDGKFHPHTWEELKQIIAENRLETLKRRPSDLERYIKWSAATKKQYGSIIAFVMQNRLQWTQSPGSIPGTGPIFSYENPTPFENANDYKILPNDWPYGLDRGITHLIVWLKNRLETEPTRGDLTSAARTLVQSFVNKEFVTPVAELTLETDNVLWFKNWVSLQSVPGIDHVHILIRNVPEALIDKKWLNGERRLQDRANV